MIYDKTRALEPGYYENFELCYKPALEKDRKDAERYRRLAVLVEAGEWGCFYSVIIDSYGKTDDTYMNDKKHMDEVLDSEEVVTSADEWARCFGKATEPLLVAPPVTIGKAELKYIPAPNVTCNGHIVILEHTEHLSGSWDKTCPACIANAKAGRGD